MSGRIRQSARRGPDLDWETDRSDPRFAPPRALALGTLALPVGFAVAEATGVRPIGGAVMAALALGALLASGAPWTRRVLFAAVLLALFVLSHAIADTVGRWAAIALVTVAAGTAAFWVLRPRQPGAPGS